jgi:hypothetical protein
VWAVDERKKWAWQVWPTGKKTQNKKTTAHIYRQNCSSVFNKVLWFDAKVEP